MSYDEVQKIIDGDYKNVNDLPPEYFPVGLNNNDEFFENIKLISRLGLNHRMKRE